jgi:hypothetical protein
MAHAHCMLRSQGTDTHSEYVMLIALPLQQWLRYTSSAYLVIKLMSFSTMFIRSWNSYTLIRGLPFSKVKTIMCYGRTPSFPFILYALLITILTKTDLGHSPMPNSTVLQYTHCAVMHAILHHGAESENDFRLTITWNFICCYNSNKRGHAILVKSQYYNTRAATRFRPHWSIIRENNVVPTFV